MVSLLKIELDHFKSFDRKVVVPIKDGFTTISGPNGSGKSNVVDSLLFVFGASSSKGMRADRLTDLIHSGNKKNYAKIAVKLALDEADAANLATFYALRSVPEAHGKLPPTQDDDDGDSKKSESNRLRSVTGADAANGNGDGDGEAEAQDPDVPPGTLTIEIGRMVRRVRGGSQSVYSIDGRPVTMGEVHDVMRALGIPPSGHNIIMQGDVTSLTRMSALERRRVVDDLAGVSEFDLRIRRADEELGAAARHMDETQLVLDEVEPRLRELLREREQALRYIRLRDERQRLLGVLARLELREAKDRLHAITEASEEAKAARKAARERLIALSAEIEDALTLVSVREGELAALADGEKTEALRALESLRAELRQARERRDEAVRRRNEAAVRLETAGRELGEVEGRQSGVVAQADEARGRLQALEAEADVQRAEVSRVIEELTRRHEHIGVNVARMVEAHRTLQALRERHADARRRLDEVGERRRRLIEERERLSGELAAEEDRLTAVAAARSKAQEDLAAAREKIAAEEARVKRLIDQRQRAKHDLERSMRDRENAMRKHANAENEQRLAHERTGHRSLTALKRAGLAGIEGAVLELIQFEPEHASAIEAAAGGKLWWVVTEDERVAAKAVELLKAENAGRLTFLPLTKLRPPSVVRRDVDIPGFQGYMLDLVTYKRRYDDAFRMVFGDTIVVAEMRPALPYVGSHRMVTLDGEVLERRGQITGGSRPRGAQRFADLARKEEEVSELKRLLHLADKRLAANRSALDELEGQSGRLQSELPELKGKLERASAEVDQANIRHAEVAERAGTLRASLAEVHSGEEEIKAQSEPLAEELRDCGEAVEVAEQELAAREGDAAARPDDGVERSGDEVDPGFEVKEKEAVLKRIDERVKDERSRLESLETEKMQGAAGVARLKNEVEDAQRARDGFEQQGAHESEQCETLTAELAEREEAFAALEEEVKDAKHAVDAARENVDKLRRDEQEASLAIEKLEGDLRRFEERRTEAEAAVEEARAKVRALGIPEEAPPEIIEPETEPETAATETEPGAGPHDPDAHGPALEELGVARAGCGAADTGPVESAKVTPPAVSGVFGPTLIELGAADHPDAFGPTRDELGAPPRIKHFELATEDDELLERGNEVDRIKVGRRIKRIERTMQELEPVNMLAIDQYAELEVRRDELTGKLRTLEMEKDAVHDRIARLEAMKRQAFLETFAIVRTSFAEVFRELAHGHGELYLENEDDPFQGGLVIRARIKGQSLTRLEAMSGGEKSLTALAFVFALQSARPSPFYLFDEVDSFLDSENTRRLSKMIRDRGHLAQFIVVSHRRPMVEQSHRTIGVYRTKTRGSRITGIELDGRTAAEGIPEEPPPEGSPDAPDPTDAEPAVAGSNGNNGSNGKNGESPKGGAR